MRTNMGGWLNKMGEWLSTLAEKLGLKPGRVKELKKQLAALEDHIRKQHDILDGLKDEIVSLERGMVKKKQELDVCSSDGQKRILVLQITQTFNDLKGLQGRENIAAANLNKLSLLAEKIRQLALAEIPVASEEQFDDVAVELEESIDGMRRADRAAKHLEEVQYEPSELLDMQEGEEILAKISKNYENQARLPADVEKELEKLLKSSEG